MLDKWFGPKKEDICPNCGTACFATDVLCPNCGKNLDELFEQLPDLEKPSRLLQVISKFPPYATWFAALLIILSPIFVASITALPDAQKVILTTDRSPLKLIGYAISSSTFDPLIALAVGIIPLSILSILRVQMKLGNRLTKILAIIFACYSILSIWLVLQIVNVIASEFSAGYNGMEVFGEMPDLWVHFVSASCTLLLTFILIKIIQRDKTA